jgi:hypothetical protein
MIRLSPIIDQLQGIKGISFVRGVRALAAVQQIGGQVPAIYVGPEDEAATDNRMAAGGHVQKINCGFFVLLVVGGNAASTAAEVDQIKSLTDIIDQRLIGWVHPDSCVNETDAGRPTDYAGARLLSLVSGQVQWVMRFRTTRYYRKVNSAGV